MIEARILCHFHDLPEGRYYITYSWHGPQMAPARINKQYMKDADKLPWKLRIVRDEPWRGEYLVVRTDVVLGIPAAWTWFRLKTYRTCQDIQARFIYTLAIWGLADIHEAREISWADVHWPWRKRI